MWGIFQNTHRGITYKFSGKEEDAETGLVYYGARYYNAKLSVWLSVDPVSHAFPSVTPYSVMMNNPIMMIDPGGDSTHFFDHKGNHMGTINDGLDNAVAIVDKDGQEGVKNILKGVKDGKYDNRLDEMAQHGRDHGQSYDYQGLIDFGENNTTFNANGKPNEVGGYLYKDENGVIRINNDQVVEGGINFISWGDSPPEKDGAIGNFHTHPSLFGSSYPSGPDRASKFDGTPQRDVIYSGSNLIFFNSSNDPEGVIKINIKKYLK